MNANARGGDRWAGYGPTEPSGRVEPLGPPRGSNNNQSSNNAPRAIEPRGGAGARAA